jgi:hypothetical protein
MHKVKYNALLMACYKSRKGTGYCILIKNQVVAEEAIPLEIFPTVFQAKVVAILLATETLLEFADCGKIVIHSDSQVLNNLIVTSQMVWAAMLNLDTLAEKQVVSLRWVRAEHTLDLLGMKKQTLLQKEGLKWYQLHLSHWFLCPCASSRKTSKPKLKIDGSCNLQGAKQLEERLLERISPTKS